MALFIKQNEQRSQLQEKLAAELQQKAKIKADHDLPDGVEDSQYIQGTNQSTGRSWLWVLLGIIVIGFVIWLGITSASSPN